MWLDPGPGVPGLHLSSSRPLPGKFHSALALFSAVLSRLNQKAGRSSRAVRGDSSSLRAGPEEMSLIFSERLCVGALRSPQACPTASHWEITGPSWPAHLPGLTMPPPPPPPPPAPPAEPARRPALSHLAPPRLSPGSAGRVPCTQGQQCLHLGSAPPCTGQARLKGCLLSERKKGGRKGRKGEDLNFR